MAEKTDKQKLDEHLAREAAKIRCPLCTSVGVLRDEAARARIDFPCGAYAFRDMWDKHGEHALIDTNAACDYIAALLEAKHMIEQNYHHRVNFKGMLVGGGNHGRVEEVYAAICEVLP